MAKRAYVFKYNYSAPYAVATGMPHKPTAIRTRNFRQGEIINAEVKHHNNQPSIILFNGVIPIPLEAVKQVVTKEIVSSADGRHSAVVDSEGIPEKKVKVNQQNKKLKVVDMAILGAVLGFAGIYFAEKKNFIPELDTKNKLIAVASASMLFAYISYRLQNKPKVVVTE